MHVDNFIEDPSTDEYASWFLLMKRLPAVMQQKFSKIIGQYRLFCTYKGEYYRVIGASRMGDIWLAKNLDRNIGYDLRVDIADCSEFTNGA